MREYRKRPAVQAAERARNKARNRAMRILASEYGWRYEELYAQELARGATDTAT